MYFRKLMTVGKLIIVAASVATFSAGAVAHADSNTYLIVNNGDNQKLDAPANDAQLQIDNGVDYELNDLGDVGGSAFPHPFTDNQWDTKFAGDQVIRFKLTSNTNRCIKQEGEPNFQYTTIGTTNCQGSSQSEYVQHGNYLVNIYGTNWNDTEQVLSPDGGDTKGTLVRTVESDFCGNGSYFCNWSYEFEG